VDSEKILRDFGQKISAQRASNSLTQEQLAELAGLERSYISDIERGARNVGLVNIVKLAKALGVCPSEFFK
jgi:transcriptional regulator with XRE-family HTH domain